MQNKTRSVQSLKIISDYKEVKGHRIKMAVMALFYCIQSMKHVESLEAISSLATAALYKKKNQFECLEQKHLINAVVLRSFTHTSTKLVVNVLSSV